MKTGFSKSFFWLIVPPTLAVAGLITARSVQTSEAQAQPANVPITAVAPETTTQPQAATFSPAPGNSTVKNALPPGVFPASPLAQVIKMTKAGVNESVIMAYITNSGSTFNLDSDKIIYLTDSGVPDEIMSTMMLHDQQLQQQAFAATSPQPASTSPGPGGYTTETAPQPEPEPVTVNYFYNTLSPYGSWVDVPGYGRCWRPTVTVYDTSWQPYSDHGRWVYTDCGWYWASDYSWGCTFHYGRWFRDTHLGWCWWPDTAWGPSWVTWRYTDDLCGWAPLPPFAVCQPGVGFVYRGNGVSVGFDFGLAPSCFVFVPTVRFCDPHPRNFCVAPGQVTQIFNHTTVINNINIHNHTVANNGITLQRITAATGKPIRQMSVHELRDSIQQNVHGGSLNRQNRASNDDQNPSASGTVRNDPPQIPTVTTRGPQERGHAVANAQQHFTAATGFNPANSAENPESNQRTTSPRSQQFNQIQTPRNSTRNIVETRQNLSAPQQDQIAAPVVNRAVQNAAQAQRDYNQSRNQLLANARQNRSEAVAAIQSHAQQQQQQMTTASSSQPDKSSGQGKFQNLPGR